VSTLEYSVDGRVARIELNRPERGNGITLEMPRELAEAVERADLDPGVHVIALSGRGKGFCGGYDLVESAEGRSAGPSDGTGSPLDRAVVARNHDPNGTWDSVVDYQMMSRNLRGFMSLFHANKPVVCKVHGFVLKLFGKHRDKRWAQILMWPGMQLQRLTTRPPDLSQLAVAIAALEAVLAVENPEQASDEDKIGMEVVA